MHRQLSWILLFAACLDSLLAKAIASPGCIESEDLCLTSKLRIHQEHSGTHERCIEAPAPSDDEESLEPEGNYFIHLLQQFDEYGYSELYEPAPWYGVGSTNWVSSSPTLSALKSFRPRVTASHVFLLARVVTHGFDRTKGFLCLAGLMDLVSPSWSLSTTTGGEEVGLPASVSVIRNLTSAFCCL